MSNVNWKGLGYSTVTNYLSVRNASEAIAWYKKVFGAVELFRLEMGPLIGHAEITIDDTRIMLADEASGGSAKSPESLGGSTCALSIYTPDCDALFHRALQHGATSVRQPADQFYGDRTGAVRDPFGHYWMIMTHIEDVSLDEMNKRMKNYAGS